MTTTALETLLANGQVIGAAELADALAALDLTPEVIQNFFQYVTYQEEFLTLITNLTAITENNTYITNLITQIVATINGKKGAPSELATLDASSHLTPAQVPPNTLKRTIAFVIEGGGAAIAAGVKGDIQVPFACHIVAARLLADQSGSIIVNVWKDTYANFPPTVADKITSSTPPTITTATKSQDSTLTSWTTAIAAGDILRFNVDALATSITRVTLLLEVTVDVP